MIMRFSVEKTIYISSNSISIRILENMLFHTFKKENDWKIKAIACFISACLFIQITKWLFRIFGFHCYMKLLKPHHFRSLFKSIISKKNFNSLNKKTCSHICIKKSAIEWIRFKMWYFLWKQIKNIYLYVFELKIKIQKIISTDCKKHTIKKWIIL